MGAPSSIALQRLPVDAELLYQSPYVDFSPRGVDGIFTSPQVDELMALLNEIGQRALAA